MIFTLLSDWASNRGRPQIQVALALLRLAQWLRSRKVPLLAVVASGAYRAYTLCLIGMDIPVSTKIGAPLIVHHGIGLVVHASTVIGRGVTLRHNTTIGAKKATDAPIIEDGVDIGPNSVVLGRVCISEGAKVGAGSVVVKDVGRGSVVAGNPARTIARGE